MLDVSRDELDYLLARGWRRFGPAYFRPGCAGCSECVPLRIPVATFEPTKSQRRVWKKCKHFRLEVGRPVVDEARLELYHAWHRLQGTRRGWPDDRIDAAEYYHQFAFPHPCVREFAYYDGDHLVGIGIVDETPTALSAVYTFYDPAYSNVSPGTASVLFQLERARLLGKTHVYLGYRVLGCKSSQYKAKFGPHELLHGWPELDEQPDWRRAEDREPVNLVTIGSPGSR